MSARGCGNLWATFGSRQRSRHLGEAEFDRESDELRGSLHLEFFQNAVTERFRGPSTDPEARADLRVAHGQPDEGEHLEFPIAEHLVECHWIAQAGFPRRDECR